ncbi:hypothetical protein DFH29DRAFT_1049284 [Suillus ampliporus]|nr:hypothetical protein DFH29DRAFT_1049284 [Suillus ampliporus]
MSRGADKSSLASDKFSSCRTTVEDGFQRHKRYEWTLELACGPWLHHLPTAFRSCWHIAGSRALHQRLAISRTLVRRLKLTAIHDITGACVGLGSALSSVWRQTNIPASWWMTSAVIPALWWMTFAVTAYLASIFILHVTSSTLLQFQTFNTSMATSVPATLGWPNDISYDSDANWEFMTASLPVVNRLLELVTAGLSNTTLYDTIQTSSVGGNATVNATTITWHCGLLPNVTSSMQPTSIDPV